MRKECERTFEHAFVRVSTEISLKRYNKNGLQSLRSLKYDIYYKTTLRQLCKTLKYILNRVLGERLRSFIHLNVIAAASSQCSFSKVEIGQLTERYKVSRKLFPFNQSKLSTSFFRTIFHLMQIIEISRMKNKKKLLSYL